MAESFQWRNTVWGPCENSSALSIGEGAPHGGGESALLPRRGGGLGVGKGGGGGPYVGVELVEVAHDHDDGVVLRPPLPARDGRTQGAAEEIGWFLWMALSTHTPP